MAGTLYLVPTPIGNLGDISRRIADTLGEVDFIAAEDTRVTLKLLNHLGLKKPMLSYYRHNTGAGGEAVLSRLLAGESCALVTDAGTPAVSDPGEELVALCAQSGVDVVAIPGPCALVTALAVSGLPTGRFTFEGFLAMNKKNRRTHLEELKGERRTMIFYEAPHKLCATLDDLAEAFGPGRRISLCRELTKLHEEVRRTTLGEAAEWYGANPPRGEFVLVVEGAAGTRPGCSGTSRTSRGRSSSPSRAPRARPGRRRRPLPAPAGWPGWRRCGPRASPCGTQCGRRRGKQAWLKMNFTTVPWGKPAAANKTVRKKGHPYLEVFGIENITISIIGKPRNTCGFDRKKGQKEKKTPCFFRKARCFYNMKRIVILTEALECSWDRRSFP